MKLNDSGKYHGQPGVVGRMSGLFGQGRSTWRTLMHVKHLSAVGNAKSRLISPPLWQNYKLTNLPMHNKEKFSHIH